jgi:tRNA(fMet)-specific endonuclease VapC
VRRVYSEASVKIRPMIADTCFIIDIMRNDPEAITKAREIEDTNIPLMVSAPTVFELNVGLSLSTKPTEEKERIREVLDALLFLPLDYNASIEAGRIYGTKRKQGETINPQDAMIAGTARSVGDKILTRNIKHFQGIENVSTVSY